MGIVFMLLVFAGPRLAKVFKADRRPPDVPVRQEFEREMNEIIQREFKKNQEVDVDEDEEEDVEVGREER